jgi:uncharacterized coiled-coil DUF342 family protein
VTPEQIAQMRADMAALADAARALRSLDEDDREAIVSLVKYRTLRAALARYPNIEASLLTLLAERDELRERAERAKAELAAIRALDPAQIVGGTYK